MGLGAFPASDPLSLGMVGMHGMYESNHAMHDCDLMINIGARFDDRVTGRLAAFSPGSTKIHVDIDPILDQQERPCRSRHRRRRRPRDRGHAAGVEGAPAEAERQGAGGLVGPDQQVAQPRMPALSPVQRRDQAAVRAAAAVRRDQGPRLLHHHRGRPAPDVGRPVHQVREAVPLADLRRPRHHGLRPAGGDRRADRPSRSAGDRRGGRSLDHDEHPGDVDRGAVPHAGQDLHPEQPLDGHGAAVAGAAAWRPLFRELQRRAAGLREAGRRVRLDRPARDQAGRDGRHHQDHDRDSGTGDRRRRGRREGELLPDDPVGMRRTTRCCWVPTTRKRARCPKKAWCWCDEGSVTARISISPRRGKA